MTPASYEEASPFISGLASLRARFEPRRWIRGLVLITVLSVIAVFSATASNAGADTTKVAKAATGELNRMVDPNFDPDTWKPTAEMPLPAMESPITFKVKDDASYWFDTELEDAEEVLHTRSLAAGVSPTTLKFDISEPATEAAHTVSFVVWPEGAKNMPFTQPGGVTGEQSVDLITPGLYAWQCIIHPYMLGAAVIDDVTTPGADFGPKLKWIDGGVLPSSAHEVMKTVQSFFIITEPANWQIYKPDQEVTWDPQFPAAPIMTGDANGNPHLIPNLHEHMAKTFETPKTLKPPKAPTEPGVGTVYYGSQWETSAGKTKPGSITAFDTETWKMKSKWFGPSVNLNNPHNFWSDRDGQYFYSTNWYEKNLTVLDRSNGAVVRELEIGPSPSHIVTRSTNDNLIIPNNGGGRVTEVAPGGTAIVAQYLTQGRGENPAFPHGHWVTGDGKYIITPNSNELGGSIIDMDLPGMVKPPTGHHPVAASASNDNKRAYIANLFSHTITCISIQEPACATPGGDVVPTYNIDLRANYDPVSGKSSGPYGLAPIQLPVSPDDNAMVTVGTVTGNILIIDPKTNKFVKTLPCGPGCHGANWGAKKGGGYYGYVTTKFMNKMVVIEADPDGNGDLTDARIAGEVLTDVQPGSQVQMDDTPTGQFGQGGNGIFIWPIAYNGWVQTMPDAWKAQLTCQQREPLSPALC
ncbi:MAG: YncE family protein [Acidimicrobiia bacterium]